MRGMGAVPMPTNSKRNGQRKAALEIHASFSRPFDGGSYHTEEKKRIEDEIKGLEKELAGFDDKKAAAKVRESLNLELERKRLRLRENELSRR
jgi:hypothetical protein